MTGSAALFTTPGARQGMPMPQRPLQVLFSEQEENQYKEFGLRHMKDPAASGSIPYVTPFLKVVQTVELSSRRLFLK